MDRKLSSSSKTEIQIEKSSRDQPICTLKSIYEQVSSFRGTSESVIHFVKEILYKNAPRVNTIVEVTIYVSCFPLVLLDEIRNERTLKNTFKRIWTQMNGDFPLLLTCF